MKIFRGELYYKGHKVRPETFKVAGKDLRKLVGCCCDCGKTLRGRAAVPAPEPFRVEIFDDNTPVVQCEPCATHSRYET